MTLDDEGAAVGLEGVGVDLEESVLVLAEDERERVEGLGRAEPGEARLAPRDVGPEVLGVALAHHAVHAVGRHHEVGLEVGLQVVDLVLEVEPDPQPAGPLVQDLQHALAGEAAEPVSGAAHPFVVDVGVDVAPVGEVGSDLGETLGVGVLDVVERLVRKDHAPAERVVGPVAFVDVDLRLGVRLAHEDGEEEGGRSASDARDPQRSSSRPLGRASLPASTCGAACPLAPPAPNRSNAGPAGARPC